MWASSTIFDLDSEQFGCHLCCNFKTYLKPSYIDDYFDVSFNVSADLVVDLS